MEKAVPWALQPAQEWCCPDSAWQHQSSASPRKRQLLCCSHGDTGCEQELGWGAGRHPGSDPRAVQQHPQKEGFTHKRRDSSCQSPWKVLVVALWRANPRFAQGLLCFSCVCWVVTLWSLKTGIQQIPGKCYKAALFR